MNVRFKYLLSLLQLPIIFTCHIYVSNLVNKNTTIALYNRTIYCLCHHITWIYIIYYIITYQIILLISLLVIHKSQHKNWCSTDDTEDDVYNFSLTKSAFAQNVRPRVPYIGNTPTFLYFDLCQLHSCVRLNNKTNSTHRRCKKLMLYKYLV